MSDIEFSASSPFTFIQNILSTTKCYDIMQNSSKVICIYIFTLHVLQIQRYYVYILLFMIIIIIIMMYVFISLGYCFRDNNTIPISILCFS